MPDLEMIRVIWLDSAEVNGWHMRGDVAEIGPDECRSVAWLVRDDDEGLLLARCQSTDAICGLIAIPRETILNVERLAVATDQEPG